MPEIIPNIHPFFVHFPIALTITCFMFLWLGYLFNKVGKYSLAKKCHNTSQLLLWLLGIFTILTIIAGFYAFYDVKLHNAPSHSAMVLHRNIAILCGFCIFVFIIWAIYLIKKKLFPSTFFIVLFSIPTILVLLTGYLGAELVFRHSIGVLKTSNPTVEMTMKSHDH
ncbi:hypothetical protein fh0823_27720 (plasmid) [Francisella halioticida]|uniref:DUF2231 domain-containing protein n=1 Tax=Francisella halioticida TaxID=549298 RepID=UPI001AF4665E|nr:DUF2231 domain-containing protein [Francisella halioticida]BCD92635.1 hypothetical protein fh0823_27720 [Francisella halioticida]